MLHFSCDICGQHLRDQRYVVRMEVYPAFDAEDFSEEDLEADHLQEISESIQKMETTGDFDLDDVESKRLRFDLCSQCRQKFLKDPLGREALRWLNFSEN